MVSEEKTYFNSARKVTMVVLVDFRAAEDSFILVGSLDATGREGGRSRYSFTLLRVPEHEPTR